VWSVPGGVRCCPLFQEWSTKPLPDIIRLIGVPDSCSISRACLVVKQLYEAIILVFLSPFLKNAIFTQESRGVKGSQCESRLIRRTQEQSGGFKRIQEDSRGFKRIQEDSRDVYICLHTSYTHVYK
jgi:hypothetical protein